MRHAPSLQGRFRELGTIVTGNSVGLIMVFRFLFDKRSNVPCLVGRDVDSGSFFRHSSSSDLSYLSWAGGRPFRIAAIAKFAAHRALFFFLTHDEFG